MKPANIVLFKKFCRKNGINQFFAGMYRQFRFPESPDDVEEYLIKVDSRDVIINAFKFPEEDHKQLGVNYWLDVAIQWEKTLKAAEVSGYYSKPWGNPEYRKEERIRPLAKPSDNDSPRTDEVKVLEQPKSEKPEYKPYTEPRSGIDEATAVITGFEFFDSKREVKSRLSNRQISIGYRSGHRITFGKELSEEIRPKGLKMFRAGAREGNLYFIFSNDAEGVQWRINQSNVVVSNKKLIDKVLDFLGQKKDYSIYTLSENMSRSDSLLVYKVKKIEEKEEKKNKIDFM